MTLQEAINRCKSEHYEFPDIMDSNSGLFEVLELDIIGIPSWNRIDKTRKRKIILEIRTFKGISSDAIHYYGKLIVDGVYQATINNIEKPRNLSDEQEKKYPLLTYKYEFKIRRPLSKKEIETNYDRWYAYSEGDLIEGYETIEELIRDTKDILRLRFIGEWDYWIQYPRGNKEILYI
jgi:hypothetical protein